MPFVPNQENLIGSVNPDDKNVIFGASNPIKKFKQSESYPTAGGFPDTLGISRPIDALPQADGKQLPESGSSDQHSKHLTSLEKVNYIHRPNPEEPKE